MVHVRNAYTCALHNIDCNLTCIHTMYWRKHFSLLIMLFCSPFARVIINFYFYTVISCLYSTSLCAPFAFSEEQRDPNNVVPKTVFEHCYRHSDSVYQDLPYACFRQLFLRSVQNIYKYHLRYITQCSLFLLPSIPGLTVLVNHKLNTSDEFELFRQCVQFCLSEL